MVKPGLFGPATFRWPDRPFELTVLRLVVWLFVLAISHQGIVTDAFKLTEWMDDHQFYAWEYADRETLVRWGQLPAWNPFWCGGTIGIGAPEDPFLGPDFLLRIFFGIPHGRRLSILLLVVMGMEGTYRLCRRLDASAVGAAFAAIVYATCNRFVGFIHDGWINFLGFELIPWVLYCHVASLTEERPAALVKGAGRARWLLGLVDRIPRWRLLGGFFFAWIVMSAGTYPTPFTLIALAYVTFALSIQGLVSRRPRAWLDPWLSALTIGVVALGVSFGKLLPTLAFLRQFPRVFTPVETHALTEVFASTWTVYSAVIVLMLVAVVTADKAGGIFGGGALLAFALGMGDSGDWSPFHLLKSLPIFSQLRFPDRYAVLILFFSAVAASRGITRLQDFVVVFGERLWDGVSWAVRRPSRLPREIRWLVVGAATYGAAIVLLPQIEDVLKAVKISRGTMYVDEAPHVFDQEFRQHRGNRRDAHVFPAMNMGTLYCVAGNPLPESPRLRGDLPNEEYPAEPDKATVKRKSWSPNVIVLDVDAREATTIYVNQNWAPAWKSNVGTVRSVDKLLAVDVPKGTYELRLAYRDWGLTACLLVTFASLLGLALIFGRDLWRVGKREIERFRTLPTWPHEAADPPKPEPEPEADAR